MEAPPPQQHDAKDEPGTAAGALAAVEPPQHSREPPQHSRGPPTGDASPRHPTAAAATDTAQHSTASAQPAAEAGPAPSAAARTSQHTEHTADQGAASAAVAGSGIGTAGTASTSTVPAAAGGEPQKSCNLCCMQFPRSEFKVLSGGRRASYCVKCTSYICQGRTRRLSIHDLRRAMQNNALETLLRGEAPLPPDHKRCQLCAEVLALANFRQLPRGGHESYCGTCSKYVRRGTKLGLNIEGVRKAREDGTLDSLVKDMVTACKPGHKRCNLCSEEKEVNDFSTTSKGRSSYCTSCERIVRRGHNKGLQMETMRNAFKDGSIHNLLPAPSTSARPDRKTKDVPDGYKVCNLCESVLAEAAFKLKYDGSLGSYCSTCDKLVGRGRRRGLTMEAMRSGFKDGSLPGLLDSSPVTGSVGAGPAEAREGAAAAGAGSKECNLCARQLPLSNFRVSAGTRMGAYCMECDKLIGRGRRRGHSIDALRQFMAAGQLQDVLGMLRDGSRSGEGSGGSEALARSLSLEAGGAGSSGAGTALQSSGSAALMQAQQTLGPVGGGGTAAGADAAGLAQSQQHGASLMAVPTPVMLAAHRARYGAAGVAGAVSGGEAAGGSCSASGLKRDLEGAQLGWERQRPKVSAEQADPERTDSETLSD
eukprot:jgi/Ulvmu1/2678/UM014_0134.1